MSNFYLCDVCSKCVRSGDYGGECSHSLLKFPIAAMDCGHRYEYIDRQGHSYSTPLDACPRFLESWRAE